MKDFSKQESDMRIIEDIKSKDKLTRIVGLYARAKKIFFDNDIQIMRFHQRHKGDARYLDCYSDRKIIRTLKHLIDEADFKWNLGTVSKFIDEDFDELVDKKPIIILKDGERIYDVERLTQLERDKRIQYQDGKWYEVG